MKLEPRSLVDMSFLTKVQEETLAIEIERRKNKINMEDVLRKRKTSGISRGTHYRVLRQAKNNIKASLFTLAVAARLGVVNVEDVQKLILSASAIPNELDPVKGAEILSLVDALAERIVMATPSLQV